MGKSLKEQLLAAGLATRKQAHQVEHDKRKQARTAAKPAPDPVKSEVAAAVAAKTERDRALNSQREQERARRALVAELEQLIAAHRLETTGGEVPFRFVVRDKVKKIYLKPEQQQAVVRGTLAIARYRDSFAVIPREAAEKIAARDARTVVVLRNGDEPDIGDDPAYAEYKVPDDLMW
jgi:uncharacterized protein YaiL (DUF2058 family)